MDAPQKYRPPWRGAGFVLLSDLHNWLHPDEDRLPGESRNFRSTRDRFARLGVRFAPFGKDKITTVEELERGIKANFEEPESGATD